MVHQKDVQGRMMIGIVVVLLNEASMKSVEKASRKEDMEIISALKKTRVFTGNIEKSTLKTMLNLPGVCDVEVEDKLFRKLS